MPSLVGHAPPTQAEALALMRDEKYRGGAFRVRHPLREVWTKEYIDALAAHLDPYLEQPGDAILEIGAGDGRLGYYLNAALRRPCVVVTDAGEGPRQRFPIILMRAEEAMLTYSPSVVLCSWMPTDRDLAVHVREGETVEEYILIGEVGAEGSCGTEATWAEHPGWERRGLDRISALQLTAVNMLPFAWEDDGEWKRLIRFDGQRAGAPPMVRSGTISWRRS